MLNKLVFLIPALLILLNFLQAVTDLETDLSDFVQETKIIDLKGYHGAHNPSIIYWKDEILMSFRIRSDNEATHKVGLVRLDRDFNPVSIPQEFEIIVEHQCKPFKTQDPRLIYINESLYMIFNEMFEINGTDTRRMVVAKLVFDGVQFVLKKPEALLHFDKEMSFRNEKNWVPFEYKHQLLLAYSLNPHRILKPILGKNTCETVCATEGKIKWNWGILRGGTPALLIGDEYLAFFHSAKDMTTLQSNKQHMVHYFMGAYTFNSKPPFNVTAISSKPIIGKNFYTGTTYNTWKPLRVIFPGGFIFDENSIWIAYGRQDHEIWIVKLDKEGLLKSLIPVQNLN